MSAATEGYGTSAPTIGAKLHRASCIVGLMANKLNDDDDPLGGETLKAAEELILHALAELEALRVKSEAQAL